MTFMEIFNTIADCTALSSIIPIMLFIGFYMTRSPWKSTAVGRSLMYQTMAMGLVMLVVLLSVFLGDYPGRPFVRMFSYIALHMTLWRMLATLLYYQREKDPSNHPGSNPFFHRYRWGGANALTDAEVLAKEDSEALAEQEDRNEPQQDGSR